MELNDQRTSVGSEPRTCIVADDLTGAADAALPFWRAGKKAVVVLDPRGPWPAGFEVMSICTDTRARSEEDAAKAVAVVAARLPAGATWFKKIDSTLRGWVGAETRELCRVQPARRCVFAPAYPSRGRTWDADGVYRVAGVPLAETEFADEVTGLDGDSRLGAYLGRQFGKELPICVPASAESDFAAPVHAVQGPVIWVGSSGLALSLAGPAARPQPLPDAPERLFRAPIVVAVGSRRTLAERQVRRLQQALSGRENDGGGVLRVGADVFDAALALQRADDLGRRAAEAANNLAGGAGLIVTGGDIAAATLRHLGATEAEVVGEVEDGLPVLRVGRHWVVTKAGGFGDEFSIVRAYARLSEFCG